MKIWDRVLCKYTEEKEFEKKKLELLYNTLIGRILLKLIISRKYFSKLCAGKQKSRRSCKKIYSFVKEYNIDMSGYDITDFNSFDDFFIRKREYKSFAAENELIAISDARLSVYTINENLSLKIKNSIYTIDEITGGILPSAEYQNGICLIYRLAVEDYHRYVFCDNGNITRVNEINGVLHTVRPVSEKYKVYSRNHRISSVLQTEHFGDIIQTEVGALLVGKINNHPLNEFAFLQEKGYFSYGGSTILQFFKENTIAVDDDIIQENQDGIEVKVRIGDSIGKSIRRCDKC